jgi:hypothetical protein
MGAGVGEQAAIRTEKIASRMKTFLDIEYSPKNIEFPMFTGVHLFNRKIPKRVGLFDFHIAGIV